MPNRKSLAVIEAGIFKHLVVGVVVVGVVAVLVQVKFRQQRYTLVWWCRAEPIRKTQSNNI